MRKMLKAAGIVVSIVALTSATALAGAGERPKVRFNAADQASARAAMIRRGDLRPACCWKGGPVKPDFSTLSCPNYQPKVSDLVVTGAAASAWQAGTYEVQDSQATILQTAHMVRVNWQREIEAPTLTSCIHQTLVAGGYEGAGPVTKLAFPRVAPNVAAFSVLAKAGVWIEFVALARGRTEIEVDVIGQSRAEVSATALRLSRLLAGRIEA